MLFSKVKSAQINKNFYSILYKVRRVISRGYIRARCTDSRTEWGTLL
nr:MAG TPA_asm: hypothetical protein [Caudoviricetes sp.]